MKIAIMTSSFRDRREGGPEIPYPESMARCKAAGFDVLDLNMCSMKFPERNVLCGDDWENYVDEILKAKEEHQIEFCQTHPPYRGGRVVDFEDPEMNEFYRKMTLRSLEITARIGAPWAVMHPVCDPSKSDLESQLALNHYAFDEAVAYAQKLGIGLAFENMIELPGSTPRWGAWAKDLVALVDDYNTAAVGACWDFGHANLTSPDTQPDDIRLLGSRLKVVHVADNLGAKDDHFVPFQGTVPWEDIIPVLTEIGFPGHLDLEVAFAKNMPVEAKQVAAEFAAKMDRMLLALA